MEKIRNLTVEHNLRYCMDSWEFEENFKVLQHDSYSKNSILLYTAFGNLPKYDLWDIEPIIRENKSNLRKLAKAWIEADGLGDTIKDIMEGYDCSSLWYEVTYNMDIDEKLEFADEIGLTYDFDWEMIVSRGYSQGDYCEIWVNTADYKRAFGAKFDAEKEQKIIDNILWDSPIFGELAISFDWTTFGGINHSEVVEFEDIGEILKCEYEADIDTDAVLAAIERQTGQSVTGEARDHIIAELEAIDYTDVKYPCACTC